MRHCSRNYALLFALLVCLPRVGWAAPKGAVRLPSAKIATKNDGVVCGFVRGMWISGRRLSGGYFYSRSSERRALREQARHKKGKKKSTLLKHASQLASLEQSERSSCRPEGTVSHKIHFNFNGAVGLALKEQGTFGAMSSNDTGSNLMKVNALGALEPLIDIGQVNVWRFLIAPNNKLYVIFLQRVALDDDASEPGCLLAEVDLTTGYARCIERDLSSINWFVSSNFSNRSLQFDDAGALYYLGYTITGKTVLRRYANGESTDLINDNIWVTDFLVLRDGRVILSGTTNSTSAQWVRRISSSGGITNLYTSSHSYFLSMFPDGNVYFGAQAENFGGEVDRYLTDEDRMDATPWFGSNWNSRLPHQDATDICTWVETRPAGFCNSYGAYVHEIRQTISNKAYAIAGISNDGVLMRYYPTLEKVETLVKKATLLQSVINHLLIAGIDAQNKNVLTLYNTDDNGEISLINADNEIEIYHLNYSSADNRIMFDGLRFSDNKYVIGQVDMNTLEVTASATGSSRLEDFQTF